MGHSAAKKVPPVNAGQSTSSLGAFSNLVINNLPSLFA